MVPGAWSLMRIGVIFPCYIQGSWTSDSMGTTTALRRALKSIYFPQLIEVGFEMDQRHAPHFIDFRRFRTDRVEFISIQWEKYGRPRFNLMFGITGIKGTVSHGRHVLPQDVDPGSARTYCCLYPEGTGSSTRHWFRQDRSLWQAILKGNRMRAVEEVIADVQRLYPQVEGYFQNGEIGPNCRQLFNNWSTDAS